jgi:hypothetical protein
MRAEVVGDMQLRTFKIGLSHFLNFQFRREGISRRLALEIVLEEQFRMTET